MVDAKSMGINDFPKEIVKNMYALVEYKGTEKEHFVYAYPTEIEAFKIYKKIHHTDKAIFKANIIYANLFGTKVMCGYEEI
ncbi:hypothetical protein FDB55_12975 [Clostridium botulinum]|nr:hypothetical protein [Clostridium botulinum]NFN14902.1 hypothetical protein [Clostridium botulinum]NFN22646.1 hypothetical protein [Clostridium botulinum]NFN43320.1 hypothetical protein [Clostridium botulinum]